MIILQVQQLPYYTHSHWTTEFRAHPPLHHSFQPNIEIRGMQTNGADPISERSALRSFDVFDTLLTRTVGRPGAAFELLERQLSHLGLDRGESSRVGALRSRAQWGLLHRTRGEVTLDEIYAELARLSGWRPEELQKVREAELALEERLLRPVEAGRIRLQQSRASGYSIAFLSDMYLPDEFIRRQLAKHGMLEEGDHVFVSSSFRKRKHEGDLFAHVCAELNLHPSSCLHIGNCANADVASARKMGWNSEHFAEGNLNRFERLWEQSGGLGTMMAGAARLARLHRQSHDEHQAALRTIAASVAAPFFTAYLLWVFKLAEKRGLRRLYFLSRDGQILLEMAKHLAPKVGAEVDLRYLFASRQAWHLPSVHGEIDDSALYRLLTVGAGLTLESIPRRIGLSPEEFAPYLLGTALEDVDEDQILSKVQVQMLGDVLRSPALASLIQHRAAEARTLLIDYLRQERVLEDEHWATVDLGWMGRLQDSLSNVFRAIGHPAHVEAFYVGLYPRKQRKVESGPAHAFLSRQYSRDGGLLRMATHLELFCSADHGRTEGYRRTGSAVEPVFAAAHTEAALEWGLRSWQETMVEFARQVELSPDLVDPWEDLSDAAYRVMAELIDHPTSAEARCLGSFPFETGMTDSRTGQLVREYGWKDVAGTLKNWRFPSATYGTWPRGSIAVSPRAIQAAFRAMQPLYDLRRGLDRTLKLPGKAIKRLITSN
jgi:FMN phosphatase YigB (HAD superfamily)